MAARLRDRCIGVLLAFGREYDAVDPGTRRESIDSSTPVNADAKCARFTLGVGEFRGLKGQKQQQRQEQENREKCVLTEEDYRLLKETTKGWNRRKLAHYGVDWPPKHGWRKQLIREYESSKNEPDNLPAWNYAKKEPEWDAEKERRSMKALYQKKSGDYSY